MALDLLTETTNEISSLLSKYDRPVPRYTSYPTVPNWLGIDQKSWEISVDRSLNEFGNEASVYVHVPYCQSLCAFCACTRVISRNQNDLASPFVDNILKELDLKVANKNLRLRDLHLGGGTPNWLPPKDLKRLIEGILLRFDSLESEISIEVDPRTFQPDHAQVLGDLGVSRVSLGIQDFHEPTLKAIKRFQRLEEVEKVIGLFKKAGVQKFNFDFVYGLPLQSENSMRKTAEELSRLRPTRVAVYSYAHLPSLKPAQKGVEAYGLPSGEEKLKLYTTLRERLLKESYREIGMDHFALPSDDLCEAQEKKTLHRNFMGYTVKKTALLLGLGPSSLSDSFFAYAQNPKDVNEWQQAVLRGSILNPSGGHFLSELDLRRREIILNLMCQHQVKLEALEWNMISDSEEIKDELVEWNKDEGLCRVTPRGRPFLRNISALFDEKMLAFKMNGFSSQKMSRAI